MGHWEALMGSNTECRRHLPGGSDPYFSRRKVLTLAALGAAASTPRASWAADPGGQLAWGVPLFPLQGGELDYRKREAILHRIQRLVLERAMYVPIWQLAFISGVGLRVGQSGFGFITGLVYTAPCEELKSA